MTVVRGPLSDSISELRPDGPAGGAPTSTALDAPSLEPKAPAAGSEAAGASFSGRDWLFLDACDTFDDAARAVVVAGKRRLVQPLVWEFLSLLRRHVGQYLCRDRIYVALWGHRERDERGIEVCAYKARACLKGTPYRIESRYGLGYRLTMDRS